MADIKNNNKNNSKATVNNPHNRPSATTGSSSHVSTSTVQLYNPSVSSGDSGREEIRRREEERRRMDSSQKTGTVQQVPKETVLMESGRPDFVVLPQNFQSFLLPQGPIALTVNTVRTTYGILKEAKSATHLNTPVISADGYATTDILARTPDIQSPMVNNQGYVSLTTSSASTQGIGVGRLESINGSGTYKAVVSPAGNTYNSSGIINTSPKISTTPHTAGSIAPSVQVRNASPSILNEKGMISAETIGKSGIVSNRPNQANLSLTNAQNALMNKGINVKTMSSQEISAAINQGRIGNRKLSAADIQNLKMVQGSGVNGVRTLKMPGEGSAISGGKVPSQAKMSSAVQSSNAMKLSQSGQIAKGGKSASILDKSQAGIKKMPGDGGSVKPELLNKINSKQKQITGKINTGAEGMGVKVSKASTKSANATAKINKSGTTISMRAGKKGIPANRPTQRPGIFEGLFSRNRVAKMSFLNRHTAGEAVAVGVSVAMGVTLGVGALSPYRDALSTQPYMAYYNINGKDLTGYDNDGLPSVFEVEKWEDLCLAVEAGLYNTEFSGKGAPASNKTISQWLVDYMYDKVQNDIDSIESYRSVDTEKLELTDAFLDGYKILDSGILPDAVMNFYMRHVYIGTTVDNKVVDALRAESASSDLPEKLITPIETNNGIDNYVYVKDVDKTTNSFGIHFWNSRHMDYRRYYPEGGGLQYLGTNSIQIRFDDAPEGTYLAGWAFSKDADRPDFITFQHLDEYDFARMQAVANGSDSVDLYAVYLPKTTAVWLGYINVVSEDEIHPEDDGEFEPVIDSGDIGDAGDEPIDMSKHTDLSAYFTEQDRAIQYRFTDGFGGSQFISEDDSDLGYAYNMNALFKTILCMVVTATENNEAVTNKASAKNVTKNIEDYCDAILQLAINPAEGRTYTISYTTKDLIGTHATEYAESAVIEGQIFTGDTARFAAVINIDTDISIETLTKGDEIGDENGSYYKQFFCDENGHFRDDTEGTKYTFPGWTKENVEYCQIYTSYTDEDFRMMFNVVFPPAGEYAYMEGNDNCSRIFNALVEKGFSIAAALGVVGNLRVECPNLEHNDIDDNYSVVIDGVKYVSLAKVPEETWNKHFSGMKDWGSDNITIEDQVGLLMLKMNTYWLTAAEAMKTNTTQEGNSYIWYYQDKTETGANRSLGHNLDYRGKPVNVPDPVQNYLFFSYSSYQALSDIERAARGMCASFYMRYPEDGTELLMMADSNIEQRVAYAVTLNDRVVYGFNGDGVAMVAVQWALRIAADNSHGYGNQDRSATTDNSGNPDYDCSSFVSAAYRYAYKKVLGTDEVNGVNLDGWGFVAALDLGSIDRNLTSIGFIRLNLSQSEIIDKNLRPGDVLISSDGGHTEIYVGNNMRVGAHQDLDGWQVGDKSSSGGEISLINGIARYGDSSPWAFVYRCPYGGTSGNSKAKEKFMEEFNALNDVSKSSVVSEIIRRYGVSESWAKMLIGTTEREGYYDDPYLMYAWACALINDYSELSSESVYALMNPGWGVGDCGYCGNWYSRSAVEYGCPLHGSYDTASQTALKSVLIAVRNLDPLIYEVNGKLNVNNPPSNYYLIYDSDRYDCQVWGKKDTTPFVPIGAGTV